MENLNEKKFFALNKEEMAKLQGGKWNVYKTLQDECGGYYTQRFNWWGLHGTSDLDVA